MPAQSNCKFQKPGMIQPIVDYAKCEAKASCVRVCPFGVFEIVKMPRKIYAGLNWRGKLKARVHGMKTASTPRADQCMSCGLCISACPENAIRLSKI